MDEKTLASFGKIEIVALPPMKVASYKITGSNPEEEGYLFMADWLNKQGLKFGENGVRNFGFDVNSHGESDYEKGIRCYQRFAAVPEGIDGSDGIEIKMFCGGRFAEMIITRPFECEFTEGWNYMFAWLENSDEKARLTNGGTCEETPCLEEVYTENGIEYMAMYLPLQEEL